MGCRDEEGKLAAKALSVRRWQRGAEAELEEVRGCLWQVSSGTG